jgi:hypothetical protein
MAEWRKVIVSGSTAQLATLQVGSNQQIGATQATTFLTGSFTGSFFGSGANLSGVTATFPGSNLTPLLSTTRIFSNDGVSNTSNTYVTAGQITGSAYAGVSGDITIGTGGVAAIGASKVTSAMILDGTIAGTDIASGTVANANLAFSAITIAGNSTSLGGSITAATILNGTGVHSGSNSVTIGSTAISLGATSTTLTGLTSVNSTGFTGSLLGTAATASFVAVANVSGLGTSVATALGVNVGSVGAFVTNGGALGTPSGGTLTNASGLPISGLVASTSTALGVGTIELGHASDTTIARQSAGIVTIEGNVVTTNVGTATFSNKSIDLTSNTLTGTVAQFNTALSDDNFATLTGTEALTNKTLTSPTISNPSISGTLAASGNVTIAGNLNVSGLISGSATYITSTNVAITDQFILLASGSGATVDAGIIVQDAAGDGEAFYWENNVTGTGRWAIASSVAPSAVTVTAAEYMVSARTAAGAPSGNPTYGGGTNGFGQMYVNTSTSDIYIYA